jgi:hypothetical protein
MAGVTGLVVIRRSQATEFAAQITGTMPVGPGPVNDAPEPSLIDPNEGG